MATSSPTPTFSFRTNISYDEKAFEKNLLKPGAVELLAKFRDALAAVEPFDVPHLEAALQSFVASKASRRDIIHAVRVATTGKAVGPGLYDCLEILGKDACLSRIDARSAQWPAASVTQRSGSLNLRRRWRRANTPFRAATTRSRLRSFASGRAS